MAYEELLTPIFRRGQLVYTCPALAETRERARTQLGRFHPGIKRFANPHQYPVELKKGEHERKTALILQARQRRDETDIASILSR